MIGYIYRLRSVEREIFEVISRNIALKVFPVSSLNRMETPLITHFKIHIIAQLVEFV